MNKSHKNIYTDKSGNYYIKISVNNVQYIARQDDRKVPFRHNYDAALEYLPIFQAMKTLQNSKTITSNDFLPRIKFSELFYDWFDRKKADWDFSTIDSLNRLYTDYILKYFGEKNKFTKDLTQSDFDNWREWLSKKDFKIDRKNRILGGLISLCDHSSIFFDIKIPYAKRLYRFNKRNTLESTSHAKEKARYVPIDEFALFLKAFDDNAPLYYFFLSMYFASGTRIGEQISLHPTDITSDGIVIDKQIKYCGVGKAIETSTKNGIQTVLPMPDFILKELLYYKENIHLAPNNKKAYLFYEKNDPFHKMSRSYVNAHRREAYKKLGLEYISNHSLRHSFITNVSIACNNPVVTQKFARHMRIATTSTYDHSGDLLKDAACEAINNKYDCQFSKLKSVHNKGGKKQ